MESILGDLMKQVTGGDNLSSIAKSVGGDEKGVQSAISTAVPLLMGSMAKSASQPSSASGLMDMLTKSGSSDIMGNLGGLLGGSQQSAGSSMVNMLLGSQTNAVANSISQKSGLTSSVVSKLLPIITPMIMSYVGKKFIEQKLDATGLSSFLGTQSKIAMDSSPDAASITKELLGTTSTATGEKSVEKSSGFWDKLKRLFSG